MARFFNCLFRHWKKLISKKILFFSSPCTGFSHKSLFPSALQVEVDESFIFMRKRKSTLAILSIHHSQGFHLMCLLKVHKSRLALHFFFFFLFFDVRKYSCLTFLLLHVCLFILSSLVKYWGCAAFYSWKPSSRWVTFLFPKTRNIYGWNENPKFLFCCCCCEWQYQKSSKRLNLQSHSKLSNLVRRRKVPSKEKVKGQQQLMAKVKFFFTFSCIFRNVLPILLYLIICCIFLFQARRKVSSGWSRAALMSFLLNSSFTIKKLQKLVLDPVKQREL